MLLKIVQEVLRPLKNVKSIRNYFYSILDDFLKIFEKCENNELGNQFIDIGLEKSTVAAARVTERPPRCRNKGVQKRRCL